MPINVRALAIKGTNGNDVIVADFAAADALFSHDTQFFPVEINGTQWNREVEALGGNDFILRDRMGDYKPAAEVYPYALGGGNVLVAGGTGVDMVSYEIYGGGIEADLQHNGVGGWSHDGWVKSYGAKPATIHGRDILDSVESLRGTAFADKITGSDGANVLHGLGGADQIWGEGGHDTIFGGDGHDKIWGGGGHDDIDGGAGHDTLYGGDGEDTIEGGDGDDDIFGGQHADHIEGGAGADYIEGGHGADTIIGGSGADTIYGGEGDDVISGGIGVDTIHVGDGDDAVDAGSWSDTIHLNGLGDNTVNGGSGLDTVVFSTQASVNLSIGWAQRGTDGLDALTSIENVTGSAFADGVIGSDGVNVIKAGGGADGVLAQGGNDKVWGGSGGDTIYGGDGEDRIYGESGDDTLFGGDDDDYVEGGSGKDRIAGGEGSDELWGGTNADTFVWNAGDHGLDFIKDFNVNEDKLAFGEGFLAAGAWKDNLVANNMAGLGATLFARTDDGWKAIAVMSNPAADVSFVTVNQRIANGTIFDVQLNEDIPTGPGGLDFGGVELDAGIQLGFLL